MGFSAFNTQVEIISTPREDTFLIHFPGKIFTQEVIMSIPIATEIEILEVELFRSIGGSSGSTIVDVLKGSFGTGYVPTSIFLNAAHRPSISYSSGDNILAKSSNSSSIIIPAYNILTVAIDSIEVDAEEIFVIIKYKDV